jgi:hypothetical protein
LIKSTLHQNHHAHPRTKATDLKPVEARRIIDLTFMS